MDIQKFKEKIIDHLINDEINEKELNEIQKLIQGDNELQKIYYKYLDIIGLIQEAYNEGANFQAESINTVREHMEFAEVYNELGETDKAITHLKEILKIQPEDIQTKQTLDKLLQKRIVEETPLQIKLYFIINGAAKTIEWFGKKTVLQVQELSELIVRSPEKTLVEKRFQKTISFGFTDDLPSETLYEDDTMTIQYQKIFGQHKLIISPKGTSDEKR